jgi:DNA-binding HxlR family transcriptional regulator
MTETEDEEYGCGLEAALAVIGGKWKPLILYELRAAPRRFGELKRQIGTISEKMLIQHLKELERDHVVLRHDFKEVPPRVEYALTDFGFSLYEALMPLCAWGEAHMKRIHAFKQESAAQGPPKLRA